MAKIKVTISGLELKNPFILSSGPLTKSTADILRAEKSGFGEVIKSATVTPCEGNPHPRLVFGKGYLVGSEGLPNNGYKAMAQDIQKAKETGVTIPIMASVAGASPEEYAEMSAEFEKKGADAVELNLACSHRGSVVGRPKEEPLGRY